MSLQTVLDAAADNLLADHCCALLETAGRPALLAHLKDNGVASIAARQALAKAVAIAHRARTEEPPKARAPLVAAKPALLPGPRPMPGPADPQQSRSQAGFFQDIRALQYHGHKVGGFYLEIGVDDATHSNNTWLLDDVYSWRGISVDPNATHIDKRSCAHFNVALASQSGEMEFSFGGPFSGLTEFVTSPVHNSMWHEMALNMSTIKVETRRPIEVLEAGEAPAVIDYMSLDVEGSEMDILRAFPFDCYTVRFATIETNRDRRKERELRDFMRAAGYTFVGHAACDDYFAHEPQDGTLQFNPPLDYTEDTS